MNSDKKSKKNKQLNPVNFALLGAIVFIFVVFITRCLIKLKVTHGKLYAESLIQREYAQSEFLTSAIHTSLPSSSPLLEETKVLHFTVPSRYADGNNMQVLTIPAVLRPNTKYLYSPNQAKGMLTTLEVNNVTYEVRLVEGGDLSCPTASDLERSNCFKEEEEFPNSSGLNVFRDNNKQVYALNTMELEINSNITDVLLVQKPNHGRFTEGEVQMWKEILKSGSLSEM